MRIAPTAQVSEMLDNAVDAAEFLKKLANPTRLMIVCALIDGERSVRDLEDTLHIRQPGLSQQLAELREAGFIEGRKESKSVFYRLADDRIAGFIDVMYRMFCAPGDSDETTARR
ncbi:MAG TPA: metalloregulator ArsR/SmtB family transcription factor [Rhizobiaceae bacterium]|nr:metalloregulator ArsR/SmtB family transcription factor [Rhizobiaceae bacterium]